MVRLPSADGTRHNFPVELVQHAPRKSERCEPSGGIRHRGYLRGLTNTTVKSSYPILVKSAGLLNTEPPNLKGLTTLTIAK